VEFNSLFGTTGPQKKMLATLKGTFWAGFVLTLVYYILVELVLRPRA
jgi:hypothetical protein